MKYIVSEDHRFIYFITQKVACSSIKIALLPFFHIDGEKYAYINRYGNKRIRIHQAYDDSNYQIGKAYLVNNYDKYNEYFKFGFVRNPWDRVVSCFIQKLHKNKTPDRTDGSPLRPPFGDKSAFFLGMTFDEFVERIHQIPDAEADYHFRSQTDIFCREESGDICMADFVGKFE